MPAPPPEIDICIVLYKPGDLENRLVREVPQMTRRPHTLRVFDNSGNAKNLSMAWNDLALEGRAPYVAFLHSDILLTKGWEDPLIWALNANPSFGAVLPNPARFDQLGRSFHLSDPPTSEELEAWASWSRSNMARSRLAFATSAGDLAVFFCVMMRRRDFHDLRGFDERLRFVGNNHEMQWRIDARKQLTVMIHSSSVWHKDALSFFKAIEDGLFVEDREGRHWNEWSSAIKSGRARKWHELSDQERRDVRRDPRFRIGGPA